MHDPYLDRAIAAEADRRSAVIDARHASGFVGLHAALVAQRFAARRDEALIGGVGEGS